MMDYEREEDEGPIVLSVRQPSYSSLHGTLVMKGCEDSGMEVLKEDEEENPVIVLTKEEENPVIVLGQEDEDDGPIVLSVRQPSFSNLHGNLIPKGGKRVEDLKIMESVIEENEEDGDGKSDFLMDLERRNAKRWKAMGYEPTNLHRNNTQQAFNPASLLITKNVNPMYQSSRTLMIGSQLLGKELNETEKPIEILSEGNEDAQSGLPSDFHLDLFQLKQTQGYDSEQGSSRIPPKLYKLIRHPKESTTFLALCGVSIVGYRKKVVDDTLKDLKGYLEKTIDEGLIGESQYVQDIIDKLKGEAKDLNQNQAENPEDVKCQIDDLEFKLFKKTKDFELMEAKLEAERELAQQNLKLKNEELFNELDEKWESAEMQKYYNKPSAALIEQKQHAKRLLKAKRFDDAAVMAREIQVREAEEAEKASKRMEEGYDAAIRNLESKMEKEEESLLVSFDTKMSLLIKERDAGLTPLRMRLQKLKNRLNGVEEKIRKQKVAVVTPVKTKKFMTKSANLEIGKSGKLKMMPLVRRRVKPSVLRTSTKASSRYSMLAQYEGEDASSFN